MKTPLLEIEDLYARVGDKEIIKGFNLTINEGEVHAIMAPFGPIIGRASCRERV